MESPTRLRFRCSAVLSLPPAPVGGRGSVCEVGSRTTPALSCVQTYFLPVRLGRGQGKALSFTSLFRTPASTVFGNILFVGSGKRICLLRKRRFIFAVLLLNWPLVLYISWEQRLSVLFTLQTQGRMQCLVEEAPGKCTWREMGPQRGSEAQPCCSCNHSVCWDLLYRPWTSQCAGEVSRRGTIVSRLGNRSVEDGRVLKAYNIQGRTPTRPAILPFLTHKWTWACAKRGR